MQRNQKKTSVWKAANNLKEESKQLKKMFKLLTGHIQSRRDICGLKDTDVPEHF